MELVNNMINKMKRGEPVVGCQLRSMSAAGAELLGYCGLDYVFIDGEHFAYHMEHAEGIIRAVQLSGATPIMRIPSHEQGFIVQALEAGIQGVVIPHIDTKEQAVHAVNEIKFPPLGKRGFGPGSRSARYGFVTPNKTYMAQANDSVIVIGMIESLEGIANLDAILTSGIDVLRIGSGDLSQDMGYAGELTAEVVEAIEGICKKVKNSDVILGDVGLGGLASLEDFEKCIARGCHMFNVGSDMAVLKKAVQGPVKNFFGFKKSYLQTHRGLWDRTVTC
jgi:4-hydroxy-2-oxoheptanedioate aldolase